MEETECGRLCTCHGDGQVTCKPRCPHIQMPQHPNTSCTLRTNPDDLCCTVPHCLPTENNHSVQEFETDGFSNDTEKYIITTDNMETTSKVPVNENENVPTRKFENENSNSDKLSHFISVAVKDNNQYSSETVGQYFDNTEVHNPTRNTSIVQEHSSLQNQRQPFTSLNELLSKHKQLGLFSHDGSSASHQMGNRSSEVIDHVNKETSNLSNELNQEMATTGTTSYESSLHTETPQLNEMVHDDFLPFSSSAVKEPDEIPNMEESEPSYLPDAVVHHFENISLLLPQEENWTHNRNNITNERESSNVQNATYSDVVGLLPVTANDHADINTDRESDLSNDRTSNFHIPREDERDAYLPNENNRKNVAFTAFEENDDKFYLSNDHDVHFAKEHVQDSHRGKNVTHQLLEENENNFYLPNVHNAQFDKATKHVDGSDHTVFRNPSQHPASEEHPLTAGGEPHSPRTKKTDIHSQSKGILMLCKCLGHWKGNTYIDVL